MMAAARLRYLWSDAPAANLYDARGLAAALHKPLPIGESGFPRDGEHYDPLATTDCRRSITM
ncbi:MAG TPA: hypothetical protein VLA45_06885 [Paracoccaceae bacterium]|nr:hypothetical protein [Paracoccaceae bacterium]